MLSLRSKAWFKYSRLGYKTMIGMLTPQGEILSQLVCANCSYMYD